MIAGFKEHGFMVAAEHMPDTCTKCPFWLTDLEMQYDGTEAQQQQCSEAVTKQKK